MRGDCPAGSRLPSVPLPSSCLGIGVQNEAGRAAGVPRWLRAGLLSEGMDPTPTPIPTQGKAVINI